MPFNDRCCSVYVSRFLVIAALVCCAARASAEDVPVPELPAGEIRAASDEAERAIGSFRVPPGSKVELLAAEPLLGNPVAFAFDEKGRVFVAETYRQERRRGVEDNRGHGYWLDDDLAAQTVADRVAYMQKHWKDLSGTMKHDDIIRLLDDTTGDGRYDRSRIFAGGFNTPASGTGAGVLVYRGNIYYTCIPDVWLLRDTDDDGKADERKSLHHGYGVRFAFRGHDLHGLTIGPDGKLYFSLGDRGYNVEHEGKRHVDPETGAIFRCNLDGSELEVFSTGTRNPQELAFDDFGNLFTGDNNSDSGDRARWVYLVEGGDTGWRMAYQYLPDRGPFNREKIWHPANADQPASIVPPIANIADGPSGLTYYPGTGLTDEYRGSFFLADFRGGAGNSGIRNIQVKPKGAGFEVTKNEEFWWGVLATDVDFSPDGHLCVLDWVEGWTAPGRGRIYRLKHETGSNDPILAEVKRLLAEGMKDRPIEELSRLLAHRDRRVRLEAQFELAERGNDVEITSAPTIAKLSLDDDDSLDENLKKHLWLVARLHSVWALGQVIRDPDTDGTKKDQAIRALLLSLSDDTPEVRAQNLKTLGDANVATPAYIDFVHSKDPRIAFFASIALGKVASNDRGFYLREKALAALCDRLEQSADSDVYLRHALIMGLTGCGTPETLAALASHPSPSVRVAAVVALQKQAARVTNPLTQEEREPIGKAIVPFLYDIDARVVTQAARAIHDAPIYASYNRLAGLIDGRLTDDALLRRVLNANYRLGKPQHAKALARFAARKDIPTPLALEAIAMLAAWEKPHGRDRVLGMWRPLDERPREIAAEAVKEALPALLTANAEVSAAAAKLAADLGIREANLALKEMALDATRDGAVRGDALVALHVLDNVQARELIAPCLKDAEPRVRAAARKILAKTSPDEALPLLASAIEQGDTIESQAALATLAAMPGEASEAIVAAVLENLIAEKLAPELHLDAIEAAETLRGERLGKLLEQLRARQSGDDPLAAHRALLHGGDAARGREIFFFRESVYCLRCHKAEGLGGEVGPDLSAIGSKQKRDDLLEALVLPNEKIAEGFATTILVTEDGEVLSGIVKSETDDEVRIVTAEGRMISVKKSAVEERQTGLSGMPEDIAKSLAPRDLRDLVEYLSSLKEE